MEFSRRTWQVIALVLFLVAISWGTCGLLLPVPTDVAGTMPMPEYEENILSVSRGCCLGPALALIFLAYLAFTLGRRHEQYSLQWGELAAVLGVALGFVVAVGGLVFVLEPGAGDVAATRAAFSAFCLLPGLSLLVLSAFAWRWLHQRDRR